MKLAVKNPTDNCTHIDVKVDYAKGGMNYATYKQAARGVYVYFRPVVVTADGFERWVLFTGGKSLLEELPRLSAKKVAGWRSVVAAEIAACSGQVWDTLQRVCTDAKVELANVPELATQPQP